MHENSQKNVCLNSTGTYTQIISNNDDLFSISAKSAITFRFCIFISFLNLILVIWFVKERVRRDIEGANNN